MRFALVFAALSAGLSCTATAAEQLDSFRVTSSGPVSYTAIAWLPQPNGDSVEVYASPTQAGVCGDPVCIGLQRWTANAIAIGSPRVKAAALQSVKAATVDSRGRIIVVGNYQGAGADGVDFGVVRFNADGSDDTSFAGDGGTVVNFGLGQSNNDYPLAVAVDRDDNVVVAGSVQRSSAGDTDFGVVRLRASDGSLDTAFSGDGKAVVFFDLGPNARIDQANAVAVGSDDKIVLGGIALDSAISRLRPVVAQLLPNGSLDTAFCPTGCTLNAGYTSVTSGRRVYYFGANDVHSDEIRALDVAGNGDIAIAGYTFSADGATRRGAVARFSANGAQLAERLEAGLLANGGFEAVRFADGYGTRILAAGQSGAGPNVFEVQAFTSTLLPDTSYGNCLNNSGFCFIGRSSGLADDGPDTAASLFLDARGRPMFYGTFTLASTPNNGRLLMQRITNDSGPLPDRIFRNGFQ